MSKTFLFKRNYTNKREAVGIDELESLLRSAIDEYLVSRMVINERSRKGSYVLLSEATGVSASYLHQFNKDKRAICITNMNKLAEYFQVKYTISNFPVVLSK